ncbi:alpha/beta hydrolase [Roseococcus sp. SYP-B2431]|uniref:alpha/beta hydrolase n=1 Tax=Roseococcus sp. SYP-B2431 TaxID=2496640 RepID=UPI0010392F5D|nr:alpha/beta hydrolase [Roseococcus sp. SYP-B2431]TCH98526.1 alpha/beta hydrolase [Roseococcus sp. SYP-B2431]
MKLPAPLRRALLSGAALLPLGACSPTGLAGALTRARGTTREQGIAYGPLPRHRLDLYAPPGLAEAAPLLVFVPGGGWRSAERGDYRFLAYPLAGLGCLLAVIDYRLWPEGRFPGFVEDTALAVRFLAAREPRRRLILMGHSAGAFNAGCVALDPHWRAQDRVGGFIGLAGPYDFGADEVDPPGVFAGTPRAVAAPLPLGPATPAMLLLHGAADTTVRPQHSADLAARAREAGVPVRHVAYPGMSHLGIVAALADPIRALGLEGGDVLGEVRAFLA